ncbi:MAG: patatin-like phospholipase family protein [Propionibacteriales bacterium]|nr:patatin-like phospholipase family protein [Propionibacteriales bacterium]
MVRALVLGGGGITGVAWELGVLEGLRRAGVDLSDADTVIGTSAGSVVGTRLRLGPVTNAYDEQLQPATHEIAADLDEVTMIKLALLMSRPADEPTRFKRIGVAARGTGTSDAPARVEVIRSRIGDPDWPERDLLITAVDVDHGRFEVFDRTSGVSLLDAVTASCAVPLVWPPVTIGGTTYVDGGMRSPANADLVGAADVAVVIAPMPDSLTPEHHLDLQLARAGVRAHTTVSPDQPARDAMGPNSLDPARRRASAEAGLRQGLLAADQVGAVWGQRG